MNKSNGKNMLNYGLLMYIVANCINKSSYYIKTLVLLVLIIYSVIYFAKLVKERAGTADKATFILLILLATDSLLEQFLSIYNTNIFEFYDNMIFLVIRTILVIITILLVCYHSYKKVDEINKRKLLMFIVCVSSITLIGFILISIIQVILY